MLRMNDELMLVEPSEEYFAELAAYAVGHHPAARAEPDGERHPVYQQLVPRQQYLVDTLHPAGFL